MFYANKDIVCWSKFCSYIVPVDEMKNEHFEVLLHKHAYHIMKKYSEENNCVWVGTISKKPDLYKKIISEINVNDVENWMRMQLVRYGKDTFLPDGYNGFSHHWQEEKRMFKRYLFELLVLLAIVLTVLIIFL